MIGLNGKAEYMPNINQKVSIIHCTSVKNNQKYSDIHMHLNTIYECTNEPIYDLK